MQQATDSSTWKRSGYLLMFVTSTSLPDSPSPSLILQMNQNTATAPLYNIDSLSRLVIQPISCNWGGCNATINSWFTLQKVCLYFLIGIGTVASC
jgi:hypothetical protein